MSSRFRWLASLAVALLALAPVPNMLADSRVRIVRLSYTLGEVQVDRGQGWERAILNMPLIEGMKLKTGPNSRAEVEFENGSTVRLGPDSRAEFSRLLLLDSGTRLSTVQIPAGTAFVNFHHDRQDQFDLNVAGQDLPLKNNVHFRAAVNRPEVDLAVFGGSLQVPETAKTVKVKKHETMTVNLGQPASYEVAKGIDPDALDNWDADRGQYQREYGPGVSYGGGVPYYGLSDLSYYGAWIDSPMYGDLWRPYYVGYNWDPFWNGAWGFYPGMGYAWISAYPWGWMPYRYGSWVFVPSYGWAWQPGNTWTAWNTMPAVVNAPANYHAPVAPIGTMTAHAPMPTIMVNRTPANALAAMRPAPLFRGFTGNQRAPEVIPMSRVGAAGPATAAAPGMMRPTSPGVTEHGYLTPSAHPTMGAAGAHTMGPGVYGRGAYGGMRGGMARGGGMAHSMGRMGGGGGHMGGGGGGHMGGGGHAGR